jgi:hypothetical protein
VGLGAREVERLVRGLGPAGIEFSSGATFFLIQRSARFHILIVEIVAPIEPYRCLSAQMMGLSPSGRAAIGP